MALTSQMTSGDVRARRLVRRSVSVDEKEGKLATVAGRPVAALYECR